MNYINASFNFPNFVFKTVHCEKCNLSINGTGISAMTPYIKPNNDQKITEMPGSSTLAQKVEANTKKTATKLDSTTSTT